MGLFAYTKTFIVNVAMPAGRTPFSGSPHHWTRRFFEAEVDAWENLASSDPGQGASQVGIEDAAGYFSSTTVEGALAELGAGGGGGGSGVWTRTGTVLSPTTLADTVEVPGAFGTPAISTSEPSGFATQMSPGAMKITDGFALSIDIESAAARLALKGDSGSAVTPTIRARDFDDSETTLELTLGGLTVNGAPGSPGEVLISNGTGVAPTWQNPALSASAIYGSFISTVDQPLTAATPYVVEYSSTTGSNGVTLNNDAITGNPTNLTVDTAGIYEATASLQVLHTGGGTITMTFWLRVDGVDLPDSASSIEMGNNNNRTLPFVPIVLSLAAGQYVEWVVMSSGPSTSLEHFPAVVGPPAVPAIPSAIVSLKRIGA